MCISISNCRELEISTQAQLRRLPLSESSTDKSEYGLLWVSTGSIALVTMGSWTSRFDLCLSSRHAASSYLEDSLSSSRMTEERDSWLSMLWWWNSADDLPVLFGSVLDIAGTPVYCNRRTRGWGENVGLASLVSKLCIAGVAVPPLVALCMLCLRAEACPWEMPFYNALCSGTLGCAMVANYPAKPGSSTPCRCSSQMSVSMSTSSHIWNS